MALFGCLSREAAHVTHLRTQVELLGYEARHAFGMLAGIVFMAMPLAIVGNNFTEEWETRALALHCTVPADHEALLRASAALGEVVVRNGGRVLPDAPVAPAHAPAPSTAAPAADTSAQTREGGALRWMLAALAGGDADG